MSETLSINPEYEKYQKAAKILTDFLVVRNEPEKADAIFLVGGASPTDTQVTKAAQLYHDKYAPKIVMTAKGGANAPVLNGLEEQEVYYHKLIALGVPDEAMIRKGVGMHTPGEAKAALPLMQEHKINPKTVILTSIPIHSRRTEITWQGIYPELKLIMCPGDEEINTNKPENIVRAIAEIRGLIRYPKQGNLKQNEIPQDILKATAVCRMYLDKNYPEFSTKTYSSIAQKPKQV